MSDFPKRIQIIGDSNAGKSTLAAKLAKKMNGAFIDLDALNWKPNWQGRSQHDPDEFRTLIREATTARSWVVAGNYHRFSQEIIWPQADTIIWLDLPLPLLSTRLIKRSWIRWRTKELLWGTNQEKFWPHLKIWHSDSLLNWLWKTHRSLRERYLTALSDPAWAHIDFIHLTSPEEIANFEEEFLRSEIKHSDYVY